MPAITNIQRYSIHDGAGIRTTVFFKGCPLACAWCHNPENITFEPELMYYADRCIGCGACVAACPQAARMEAGRPVFHRGPTVDYAALAAACRQDALEVAGREATVEGIVAHCLRDLPFYEQSGGGVTLSGGEVMAQDPEFLGALVRRLKAEGLNIAIDTCGHAPWAHFEAVLPWVDIFLYDIKLMDPQRHRQYTGVDNAGILENLARLAAAGATIHLRLPLMEGVNTQEADIAAIAAFLDARGIRPVHISLLPYHNTGTGKLARMGADPQPAFATPTPQRLEEIAATLGRATGAPVTIGG